jgi:hypothetical protein
LILPANSGNPVGHLVPAEILATDHDKAELPQRVSYGAGIVHRLGELPICRKVRITVVADHKRDPILRIGAIGQERQRTAVKSLTGSNGIGLSHSDHLQAPLRSDVGASGNEAEW